MTLAAAMAATVLVCPSPRSVFTVPAQHENMSVCCHQHHLFMSAGDKGNKLTELYTP